MPLSALVTTTDPKALSIVINKEITDGLEKPQVEAMQDAVFTITSAHAMFNVVCAEKLSNLKNFIRGSKSKDPRQWSKFKKSGLLPFSAREISDLVSGWEGWMKFSDLEPHQFNLVGIRTIATIANASADVQKEVEQRLARGERVTEKDVIELIGEPKTKKSTPAASAMIGSLAEAKLRVAELEEEYKTLIKANEELRALLDKNKVNYKSTLVYSKSKAKARK